jgi:hypothetical protein
VVISCRDVTEQANDHMERQLPFWARMQFRMHLFACTHCRAYIEQIRKTIGLVGAIKLHAMSPSDEDALVKAILSKPEQGNRHNPGF